MNESKIKELFWKRDPGAAMQAQEVYGPYLYAVAANILQSCSDAEEVVNDTLLAAWNQIPPDNPESLGGYLAAIARNLSLKKYRENHAGKRGGGQIPLVLEELQDVACGLQEPEGEYQKKELERALTAYLQSCPEKDRYLFLQRYWYLDSTSDIAQKTGLRESSVRAKLSRMRKRLKKYLKDLGWEE